MQLVILLKLLFMVGYEGARYIPSNSEDSGQICPLLALKKGITAKIKSLK